MTASQDSGESQAEARYRDLLFLHAQAPEYRDIDLTALPGWDGHTLDDCIEAVAAASVDEIPVSARLGVLYDLARAGVPQRGLVGDGYRRLADSALALKPDRPPELVPDRLVQDMIEAATEQAPFRTKGSAGSFAHHETAFIGENVCTIRRVRVGGVRATWVFSEFETDAQLDGVAGWVDPRNWRTWGPLFFRRMDLLGAPPAPVGITPPPDGQPHWQGVFHEEVRLVKLVNTLLRCSYWRGEGAAGMTYDLDLSLDGEIDVDRGFLLVTDLGSVRRVQVLKIVSFTTEVWDLAAELVCPFWTDWIRAAVVGGSTTVPTAPTHNPEPGGSPCAATVDAWVRFFESSAAPYVALGSDVTSRISSREYSTPDLLADGTRLWSRLAKDWARAWTSWTDTVEELAQEGLDGGFTPPGVPREPARRRGATTTAGTATTTAGTAATAAARAEAGGTVVPVTGLAESDQPVSSDLVSIDAGTAVLPARDVTVTVQHLQGGGLGARVQTTNTTVPHGLYVGHLDAPDGRRLAPVHLYVSRATGA